MPIGMCGQDGLPTRLSDPLTFLRMIQVIRHFFDQIVSIGKTCQIPSLLKEGKDVSLVVAELKGPAGQDLEYPGTGLIDGEAYLGIMVMSG